MWKTLRYVSVSSGTDRRKFLNQESQKEKILNETLQVKIFVCTTECSQVNIVNKHLHYYGKFQLKATMPIDSSDP